MHAVFMIFDVAQMQIVLTLFLSHNVHNQQLIGVPRSVDIAFVHCDG